MNARDNKIVHKKDLIECPEWTASIGLKISAQDISEEAASRENPSDMFSSNVAPNECQISILEESIEQKLEHENLDFLNGFIEDLKKKNLLLEGKRIESEKIIKRFQDK